MKVQVRLNTGVVEAEVVKERGTTVLVKLPDGNMVTRKKKRDFPNHDFQITEPEPITPSQKKKKAVKAEASLIQEVMGAQKEHE